MDSLGNAQLRDLLVALFEATPDGVIAVDAAGKIVVANGAAADMFGYPRDGSTTDTCHGVESAPIVPR